MVLLWLIFSEFPQKGHLLEGRKGKVDLVFREISENREKIFIWGCSREWIYGFSPLPQTKICFCWTLSYVSVLNSTRVHQGPCGRGGRCGGQWPSHFPLTCSPPSGPTLSPGSWDGHCNKTLWCFRATRTGYFSSYLFYFHSSIK